MITEKDKNLLQAVIDTYGCCAQQDIAIEEMSELTKAIIKFRRSFVCFDRSVTKDKEELRRDVAEEIADVIICIEQLKLIYGVEEDVDMWLDRKLNRISERVSLQQKVQQEVNLPTTE